MPGPFVPVEPRRGRRFAIRGWLTVGTLAVLAALAAPPSDTAAPDAVQAPHGIVVSANEEASRAGLEMLEKGGNSIDATVATALALAVSHPLAGNLGGGGFLLYRPAVGDAVALDFRETAPRALEPEMFLDEDGRPVPGLSLRGGLAVGVPGTVAGLHEAHRKWGRLPWPDVVQPAIRLAVQGPRVTPYLAGVIRASEGKLRDDPDAHRIFLPGDQVPQPGTRLVQTELAATLRRIAREGASGFYRGPVAEAIVETVRAHGGVMRARDLRKYRPVMREPLVGSYRGQRILAFPPPSSGGVALLQILGMLERFDIAGSGPGASQTVHLMAEAERRAYADRSRWLGDPAFYEVPVAGLLDPDYLSERAATITMDRATPSHEVLPGQPALVESPDTLHFSVADADGAVVSLTTTLNGAFGTGIVAPGTGVLLNNEIDDFALAPGVANKWGLLGSEANAVAGGKRPLSSMTPAIVEGREGEQRPHLVLGSPGGGTIITSLVQVVINVLDHDMPLQEAVNAARFHHQWQPDEIRHEVRAFPEDVRQALITRGHRLATSPSPLGNVNTIASGPAGSWLGAADPRRGGFCAGH